AFQDCLGISLRAYARERRLRAVHGAILAEGDRRSITDIAMSFGFWHLGRFSGAYAALFGCLPTETRRRVWRELRSDAAEPPPSPRAFVHRGGRRAPRGGEGGAHRPGPPAPGASIDPWPAVAYPQRPPMLRACGSRSGSG